MLNLEKKALIANTGEDSLTYLNIDKGEIIEIIDLRGLGKFPIGPYELISLDNRFVYCSNIYENSLYKVDMQKRKVIDKIYTGTYPSCLGQLGENLYIANTDSNSVSIVDLESFSLIGSLAVGEKPVDMEVDKENMKLYIANSNNSSINRIDLISGDSTLIKLGTQPLKMLLDEGELLILSSINDSPIEKCQISLLNLANLKERIFMELRGAFNTMVKINSSEIIFTTNIGNGCLYRLDMKNKNILGKTNLSGLPNKLVLDREQILYITNLSTNSLSLFDIGKNQIIKNIRVGREPNGILVLS